MELYATVQTSECSMMTDNAPIAVRWIDTSRADRNSPEYRSRLVASEFCTHDRDDLFAARPPLEALKMIISTIVAGNKGDIYGECC